MSKLVTLLGLVLTLFIAVPAKADNSEWYYVGTASSGGIVYARTSDILKGRPESTDARVWIMIDLSRDASLPYRTMNVLYSFDCTRETSRALQTNTIMPNGKGKTEPASGSLSYVTPGTIEHDIYTLVCSAMLPSGLEAPASHDEATSPAIRWDS